MKIQVDVDLNKILAEIDLEEIMEALYYNYSPYYGDISKEKRVQALIDLLERDDGE